MARSLHCVRSVDRETIAVTAGVRYSVVFYYIFSALFRICVFVHVFRCYFDEMEEILNAEDDKIEEEQGSQHGLVANVEEAQLGSSGSQFEDASEVLSDEYQLHLTIAVTEIEGEEIENEFNDALVEIEGMKSFPCSQCEKVCKSKGGLTRHTNAKHNLAASKQNSLPESFCEKTVADMVETIKSKIINEKLYGTEINEIVKNFSSTKALYDAVYPMIEKFWRKSNQDQLFESFFGLMPESCKLLDCQDSRAANLVMIHLPDYLVGFYHKNKSQTTQTVGSEDSASQLSSGDGGINPAERGPLTYVAGYIVAKLFQTSKKTKKPNEELQSLLQSMKSLDQSSYISARTRGGLVNPSKDLVGVLEQAEYEFRQQVSERKSTLRKIPIDEICNATLKHPVVKSLWENIVLSSAVDLASATQKLCLENTIKLYIKVRSFSYARDYLTKYKIKEKQTKQKALRKDLKRSSEAPI